MTFEEFEEADEPRLRETAKKCFDEANRFGDSWGGKAPLLLEAQFYMMELDRREGAKERSESQRIAKRDFRMELVVISLIGLELIVATWGIVVGVRESNQQAQIAQKQIELLEKVEKAMIRAGNMMLVRP